VDTETFDNSRNRESNVHGVANGVRLNMLGGKNAESGTKNAILFEIVGAAVLLATSIILGRIFAIPTPTLRISLGFIPLMVAAVFLKPYTTVLVFVLSDIAGALLFPQGAFFPGFTLVALLNGLAAGLLLGWQNLNSSPSSSKEFRLNWQYIVKIVVASALINLVGNLLINTYMVSLIAGKAWIALLPSRVAKEFIFLALHVAILIPIAKVRESISSASFD
jgi:ECF transporter S component (folate family)